MTHRTYPLELALLADTQFLEHDAFALFSLLIHEMLPFYTAGSNTSAACNPTTPAGSGSARGGAGGAGAGGGGEESGTPSVLSVKLNSIHHVLLKAVDPPLYDHLQTHEVLPQLYLLRWIRVLFAREFEQPDTCLAIWDWLFAAASGDLASANGSGGRSPAAASSPPLFSAVNVASPAPPAVAASLAAASAASGSGPALPPLDILIDYVCIGMISYIRFEVLDASVEHMVLSKLMRYPPCTDSTPILAVAEQLLRRGPPTTITIPYVEHRHGAGVGGITGRATIAGTSSSGSGSGNGSGSPAAAAAHARAGRSAAGTKPHRTKTQQHMTLPASHGSSHHTEDGSSTGGSGIGGGAGMFGTFTRLMFGDSNKAAAQAQAAQTAGSTPAGTGSGSSTPRDGTASKPPESGSGSGSASGGVKSFPALSATAAVGPTKLDLTGSGSGGSVSGSGGAASAARAVLQSYAQYANRSTANKTCGYLLKRGAGKSALGRHSINKRWFVLRAPYLSYYVSHQKAAAGDPPIKQSRIDLRGRIVRVIDSHKFHFEIGAAPNLPATTTTASPPLTTTTATGTGTGTAPSTAAPPTTATTPTTTNSGSASPGAGTTEWTDVRKEDAQLAREAEERERVYELFASDEAAMNHWIRALQEASDRAS